VFFRLNDSLGLRGKRNPPLIIKPIDDFFLLHGMCAVKICNRLHH